MLTPSHSATLTPPHRRRRPVVLCIDDDRHVLKALSRRLTSRRIDVRHAYCGEDALRTIEDRKPDAVISDWWMNRGDGEEVLSSIRGNAETAHIPVIMISGVRSSDFMTRMQALGANACYTKPLEFAALVDEISTLLEADHPGGRLRAQPSVSDWRRHRHRTARQLHELTRTWMFDDAEEDSQPHVFRRRN